MESMENELESAIFEKHDQDKRMFDKTVANSIANSNVDTTMKVNKNKLK